MGKRKTKAKRSASSLPKGLPVRKGTSNAGINPFEVSASHKRPKFQVHNRTTVKQKQSPSKLAQVIDKRKAQVKKHFLASKKANVFADNRIGEYDAQMTQDEQNLARLVRERNRQSKRSTRFALDDEEVLTHRGQAVDSIRHHGVELSDDDDDVGNLDAADTALHFGGGENSSNDKFDYYGSRPDSATERMSQLYEKRKMDLDDMIVRRKVAKAEKMQSKEHQAERFAELDESYAQLAAELQFRDKEKEIRQHIVAKREGKLSPEDAEMEDWDKEMKGYLHLDRKVKASERIKTPEEIRKEEAQRLHELETRRIARMNGDFDGDDFSDLSDDGRKNSKDRKRKKFQNPEILSDSEDDDEEEVEATRFTADGLVRVSKDGTVLGKFGQSEDSPNKEKLASELNSPLLNGTRVSASYRAKEQFDGDESWFTGTISHVKETPNGVLYSVDYDDGDYEEDVDPQHIRLVSKTAEELEKEEASKLKVFELNKKRQKAKEKARSQLPFVFEVPTTLEALHDMIASHAATGADASLMIHRIHKANSVRLDHRNKEKMQNFYDVLLRRFIAVGDAIYESGDGGPELERYKQLDSLLDTLYDMTQDSPESAAAVWSRRLGILQNAHAKRIRDSEFEESGVDTAFPSTGVVLALRSIGHLFPVTDLRHEIVTPALLFMGQIIAHTPVRSLYDATLGTTCAGLLIEFTIEARRFAPEAYGFLAGILRLFSSSKAERCCHHPVPSLDHASERSAIAELRMNASKFTENIPKLSIEKALIEADSGPAALLLSVLQMVERTAKRLSGSLSSAEIEAFFSLSASLLAIDPKSSKCSLPLEIQSKLSSAASAVSACLSGSRKPLKRRSAPSTRDKAIKTLAPRLINPEKFSLSKDKGKTATQTATDRARREYKREHKAVARELRMDSTMMENERRQEKESKDSAARTKRHKAFAWMENEQATMNQQVRQGGGLLQGGGMGAARAKAATGKLGIKKGGKL